MPPPGRGQQPQAEEEVDEGKRLMPNLITKLCTKSAEKNLPKSHVENPLIEGEFPGSDPSFSPEMDQKSPEGRAGPFLGQNSPQTPGFYGSDPEFSSPNLELTMEWGGPAPDSGYKSMLGLRSPDSRRTPSPELDRALIPGTTRGHLARCGSGSGSGSDPDLCPNSQTPPLDRAGSLKQGKASFPPPCQGGGPGKGSSTRLAALAGVGEEEKTGLGQLIQASGTGPESGGDLEGAAGGGGGRDFCQGQTHLRMR